jgi:hypothetical protein
VQGSPRSHHAHRHGPHHRALSRPGAVYQPRADVVGLADDVLSSREISEGKKERDLFISLILFFFFSFSFSGLGPVHTPRSPG